MKDSKNGYSVLNLRLKREEDTLAGRIYVKKHDGEDSLPKTRTVFIVGLPFQLNEQGLLSALSSFGQVEKIAFHKSGLSAVVLYSSQDGSRKLLKAAAKGKEVVVDIWKINNNKKNSNNNSAYGLRSWVENHKSKTPGNTELQQRLDQWMESHEKEEQERKAAALAAMEDDGWTVVRRQKGRKKNTNESGGGVVTVGGVAAGAAQAAATAAAAKKDTAVLGDFYRFQQRERKRNEVVDLRKAFEEDKKRLVQLKNARKFKPY
jgi:hypothetical protein